jgi:dolichol-phosphate mannosyltransferase
MKDSVVLVPTYNERENLPALLERVAALEDIDVLVLDDASPDGTGVLAEDLRRRYPRLSVLHRKSKDGLGRAYLHGFAVALERGYDVVVTMDADLSHAPEDVPRLLGALDRADVAVGSRLVEGGSAPDWPLRRRLISRFGSLYARALLGLPVRDVTAGFRAYRAEALRALDLSAIAARGFHFQVEVLRRILDQPGRRAVEVPVVFRDRVRGSSKLSTGIITEAAAGVLRLGLRRLRPRLFPPPTPVRSYGPRVLDALGLPAVTVIVPVRPGSPPPAALRAIERLDYPSERLEVLIASGTAPSRQRNAAAARARGEHLLFLDDDSEPSPETLCRFVALLDGHAAAAAIGGPAGSVSPEASGFARLAQLVFSEPWVVGRSASRYCGRGELRETDERELIGANLCVRRAAFEAAGGFDERLYPNEENELLERLRRRGWKLLYDPGAAVRRPQRSSPGAHLRAVLGYGAGRAAQARCRSSSASLARTVLACGAAGGLGATALAPVLVLALGSYLFALPALLYAAYAAGLAVKLSLRAGLRVGIGAAGLGALTHVAYAVGLIRELVSRATRAAEVPVEVRHHVLASALGRAPVVKKEVSPAGQPREGVAA